jgi:hypothetical protein
MWWQKRFSLKMLIASILLCALLTACSSLPISDTTNSLAPTPTQTSSPAPSPTLAPTLTPIPSPTPTPTTDLVEETRLQLNMELAPEIPGAEKKIQKLNGLSRVTYIALAQNEYGLSEGTYLGEFKKEVTFEGVEVGGVALIPKVVNILRQGDVDSIIFPVDISEIDDNTKVDLMFLNAEYTDKNGKKNLLNSVEINTCGKNVSISNVLLNCKLNTVQIGAASVMPDYYKVGITPALVADGQKTYYTTIIGDFDISKIVPGVYDLGYKLSETDKIIGFYCIRYSLEINSLENRNIQFDDFFRIGKCLVFLEDLG